MASNSDADIIIVGAGAAECVLAARLAAVAPDLRILVLELGPHTLGDPAVLTPARFPENLSPGMPRTRYFTSEPSQDLLWAPDDRTGRRVCWRRDGDQREHVHSPGSQCAACHAIAARSSQRTQRLRHPALQPARPSQSLCRWMRRISCTPRPTTPRWRPGYGRRVALDLPGSNFRVPPNQSLAFN